MEQDEGLAESEQLDHIETVTLKAIKFDSHIAYLFDEHCHGFVDGVEITLKWPGLLVEQNFHFSIDHIQALPQAPLLASKAYRNLSNGLLLHGMQQKSTHTLSSHYV